MARSSSNEDRISELPLKLKEIILCFLPIQEAVKTSILSKKWRHCWTTMPHLIFDDQFSIWYQLSEFHYNPEEMAIKLVSVINKVLLLHNGPVLKFTLNLPRQQDCDGEIIYEFVDQWIPLFSKKKVKQLIVEEDFEFEETTAHNFSSLDLTHLRLTSVLFPYTPAFGRFSNLVNLELVRVTSNFGQSIFNCPVLEKLALIICEGLFPINFRAPNLKCLHQVYSVICTGSDHGLAGLGNLGDSCIIKYSCMLSQCPIAQSETSIVVKILSSLRTVEKFSSGREYLKYLAARGCPQKLSQPLLYLKTLNICEMNFANLSEVSCLLCLIHSAPNLFKLHISHLKCFHYEDSEYEYCECNNEVDLKNYRVEVSEDCKCTINHLEIVTFSDFIGLKVEMELVRFLLGHSPLLKTLSIHRDEDIKEDVALTMAEEIQQYFRASPRAQIRDLEHPVIIDDFDYELWTHKFVI